MNAIIAEKLKMLPEKPGVYIMRDENDAVIYVGKARILKNRVRQYFQHTPKPPKVEAMVSHIEDFQYIITSNETEALTLESNLIKALMPRYNILLKDDKHFPYVRLDTKQDFPRFEVVRRVKKDGAKYFGPYGGRSMTPLSFEPEPEGCAYGHTGYIPGQALQKGYP